MQHGNTLKACTTYTCVQMTACVVSDTRVPSAMNAIDVFLALGSTPHFATEILQGQHSRGYTCSLADFKLLIQGWAC